ncbi:hypothetical protein KNO15_20330 [Leifsonia shinshuensis]|uniref:hypothetical protein n=1 Tax=Leifsonia shinshuensis TaxID=150026 RepID=UPI001F50B857|nr:hypothetical protein [Leifsonia shinshuensis]MCI0159056.1 hypothetical protein [Leifsonia shinshuensis]
MTVQTLTNAILILLLICWVGYRQLTWRPVSIAKMWRFPAIMTVVGLVTIGQQVTLPSLTPLDIAVVAGELVLSLGVGAWMGAIAHFRRLENPVQLGNDARYVATYESRTGVLGMVLWVVVIGIRIGVDVVASAAGLHLVTATGVIFLVFAANRAARTAVFAARLDRHAALAA